MLKLRVELLSFLAQNSKFSKTSASFCLNDLVEKVGDVKNGAAVQECFSCIAEACSLDYVTHQVCSWCLIKHNQEYVFCAFAILHSMKSTKEIPVSDLQIVSERGPIIMIIHGWHGLKLMGIAMLFMQSFFLYR